MQRFQSDYNWIRILQNTGTNIDELRHESKSSKNRTNECTRDNVVTDLIE